ncbi:MAG: glycerate kinase [Halobellus sp.]|uniref:glycerate kinase n=1 Tax=Halobellus sp. TaxID=1979212 RepID=UPI0035D3EE3D
MIRNRESLATTDAADLALECVEAGINAATPRRAIDRTLGLSGEWLRVADDEYDLTEYERVLVVGGGNAAGHATAAIETVLGDRIDDGLVVTDNPVDTDVVAIAPGGHPFPTEAGVQSTRRLLEVAAEAGPDDLVLAPITGGGSALLAAPADPVRLSDLQGVTESLLNAGATIHEINAVRKHLSAIKGGRLAARLGDATVAGVLFSDVAGDDRSVIASGPLVADGTTYADAVAVLEEYGIDAPDRVERRLQSGIEGDYPETPGPSDSAFEAVRAYVVASNDTALSAAADAAQSRGYEPLRLGSRIRGEAREAAKALVGIAESAAATGTPVEPPAVLLSGGETTVTIRGGGTGGPNQEFALSAALELARSGEVRSGDEGGETAQDDERARVTVVSVDTDGIDGNASAAGALVSSRTVADERRARAALADNDATAYLDARDALVETGATTTNVNDLRVIVVEAP